jgi:catechol 2,3-dioxygenase-like lactoylglutathione lyase family enzyme
MIRGVHSMFYSSDADALRSFLRDKLALPYTDVGEGWLIFDVPECEMGCHPAAEPPQGAPSGTHNISFYCDDIEKTVNQLKERGVEFTGDVANHGYGLVTHFKMPGNFDVQLYQPLYEKKKTSSEKTSGERKSSHEKKMSKKKVSKPKKKLAAKKNVRSKKKPRRR